MKLSEVDINKVSPMMRHYIELKQEYKDKIDVIVKQTTDPRSGRELNDPIYVIYLTNSKYDWITISEENFEKHIKKYINNF